MEQVIERYRGQWILMRVTAHDEDKWPSHGYVLAHDRSHKKLCQRWREVIEAEGPGDPDRPHYVFAADRLLRTGEDLHHALDALRERDDYDPFRWPRV